MFLEYSENGKPLKADLNSPTAIGIPISRSGGPSSFEIAPAFYTDYQSGNFIGSKLKGGSCNLETITFTPHGNGTHTECLGHISTDRRYSVNEYIEDVFYTAEVVSLNTSIQEGNSVLDFSTVDWASFDSKAIVIRSLPNISVKKEMDYSGKNAPYILPSDMHKMVKAGIQHLLIDLPSVDPEWDGGKLTCHHIFWEYPQNPRYHCSITEFCYIPNQVLDGKYILKLNIAPFDSDASPSRPVLYPIIVS